MKRTDAQWARIEPLIVFPPKRPERRGRPRRAGREILEAILWILQTGAPWARLPAQFPLRPTCHDRFHAWNRNGTLQRVLQVLAEELHQQGKLKLSECFIDACFIATKKGVRVWARPNEAKEANSWR